MIILRFSMVVLMSGLLVLTVTSSPAGTDLIPLQRLLDKAEAGQTVSLPPGDYGDVVLRDFTFLSPVTLKSAETENPARFRSLLINNVHGLTVDGITVAHPGNGSRASKIVSIENSRNVALLNSEIHGLVDGVYSGHYGVFAEGNTDITITGNTVHDVKNGFVVNRNRRVTISANHVDAIGNDAFKFIGVSDFVILNNSYGGQVYPEAGAHLDFMQFQGKPSYNGIIRGNLFLARNRANVQGIFLDDTEFYDLLIDQNIIATGMLNGIVVGGTKVSGITVRDNTLINIPGKAHKATLVRGKVVSFGNLMVHTKAGVRNGNLFLQVRQRGKPYYYGTAFLKGPPRLGMMVEDLRPVPGGGAEKFGARARLEELLNGEK